METFYPGITDQDAACPTRQGKCDTANVGDAERIVSIFGGGALVLGGLRRLDSLSGIAMTLIGGSLVYRGLSGQCTLYRALGVSTAERNPATAVPAQYGAKVERSILVNRPPQDVYRFWRNFENLPKFMQHLSSVTCLDVNRSRWVAKGPWGSEVQWDAEIINEKANELIAWRSLEGSQIDTAGSVHFRPTANGQGTEVRVSLKYNPPGGKVGIGLAKLFRTDPLREIDEDLRRLKQVLEAGEVSTTFGQPSARSADIEIAEARGACQDQVEEASDESFPASDPPAWTATSATKSAPQDG